MRKVRLVLLFLSIIIVLIGVGIWVDSFNAQQDASTPSIPSQEISSNFAPPFEIFRTPYFQFQADTRWQLIQSETTANRFVYHSVRESLVEHLLTITVNDSASSPEATRVLPVALGDGNRLLPAQVSKHCRQGQPAGSSLRPTEITMLGVRFRCNPGDTKYTVVVGLVGRSVPFQLTRLDGSTATYTILYQDVTATPDEKQIQKIMSSFQTR